MARMPSSWATSGLSSTSNLTKSTSVCSSLQAWTLGAMALQGPHHSAKASTTTSLSVLMAASNSCLLCIVSYDHSSFSFGEGVADILAKRARQTYLASCLTPIVTGEEWNLVKDVDVNVRRAEAEAAVRAVRAEVANRDARLEMVVVSDGSVACLKVEE